MNLARRSTESRFVSFPFGNWSVRVLAVFTRFSSDLGKPATDSPVFASRSYLEKQKERDVKRRCRRDSRIRAGKTFGAGVKPKLASIREGSFVAARLPAVPVGLNVRVNRDWWRIKFSFGPGDYRPSLYGNVFSDSINYHRAPGRIYAFI